MLKYGITVFLVSALVLVATVAWLWNRELGDENFFLVLSIFVITIVCLAGSAAVVAITLIVEWSCPDIE